MNLKSKFDKWLLDNPEGGTFEYDEQKFIITKKIENESNYHKRPKRVT
jgi:hypothetical protein